MSRPYINISSTNYTSSVLTLNLEAYHTRGGGPITITGLSQSLSYTILGKSIDGTEVATFSIGNLGTSSTAIYTADCGPTYLVFGGTPSTSTNVKISIGGVQITSTTASNSSTLTLVNDIKSAFSYNGFTTATYSSGNTFSVSIGPSTNTGSMFNGLSVSVNVTKGTGNSLTYSLAGSATPGVLSPIYYATTYSGGSTTYPFTINFPKLGHTNTNNSSLTN